MRGIIDPGRDIHIDELNDEIKYKKKAIKRREKALSKMY